MSTHSSPCLFYQFFVSGYMFNIAKNNYFILSIITLLCFKLLWVFYLEYIWSQNLK
jgi:hypothetical protein